jgi:bifunctional ADP-heptose synthase (sugar kinase/adenylyltransferase)
VTGAGDTVISVLTMARPGADVKQGGRPSNLLPRDRRGEVGTATLKSSDLEDAVRNGVRSKSKKKRPQRVRSDVSLPVRPDP